MTTATRDAQDNARWIAGWLAVCAVTILGMILLGGVTRLTESGLSMVDWRPIMGVIPPLSESQWLETFATYQQLTPPCPRDSAPEFITDEKLGIKNRCSNRNFAICKQ